jgi:alpha-tubulin suppressor-like RCC1 family protein
MKYLDSGDVFTWGQNKYGGLGIGNNIQQNTPQKVSSLKHIVSIGCGYYFTVALSKGSHFVSLFTIRG